MLAVDQPLDALDYCRPTAVRVSGTAPGAKAGSTGLSKSEVRKAIALRVDFSPRDIQALAR